MGGRPHVVILGGGFGGLAAARKLRRDDVEVTLVDRSNHHLFQPLLYQVATAALSAPDIATPLRKLLHRQENTHVLMGEALAIEPEARRVVLDHGVLEYDYLLLATGMVNNYFGHDDWEPYAPGLKTLREALDIRSRVLRAYEAAERETDIDKRRALLTFVIIGGGPTGVEMAGALAEIAQRTLAKDFDTFDPQKDVRVMLVEGGERLLAAMSPESSQHADRVLRGLGVEVRFGSFVSHVDQEGVQIGEEHIDAATVIWAAGLKASPLTASLDAPTDRSGRVLVEPNLSVPGRPEIFVIGDLIHLEQDGELLPGVAQTAIQAGKFAAGQIQADLNGYAKADRFRYWDKGSMATIGRAEAVAEVGRSRFSGFIAWAMWLGIHIAFLIDFRNRVAVMMEWAYAYLTWRRSARVILDAPRRRRPASERSHILRSALASKQSGTGDDREDEETRASE